MTNSRWNLAAVVAVVLQIFSIAHADVEIDAQCFIEISGEITAADAAEVTASTCDRPTIYLRDSLGGDARAAMQIGRWARERGATTVVVFSPCFSSCALIYVGGVRRVNSGAIGLHRPYLTGQPRGERAVVSAASAMFAEVRRYVAEMGITPAFSDSMINTPPESMRLFHGDEILQLVPVDDPVSDELEVAKHARRFGLAVDELRRRALEASRVCQISNGRSVDEYDDCRQAVFWGLSLSNYQSRYRIAQEICETGPRTAEQRYACIRDVMRGHWNQ